MQRLIGQGKDSGLYSMSNKTTLKHFGGGHHSGSNRKNKNKEHLREAQVWMEGSCWFLNAFKTSK